MSGRILNACRLLWFRQASARVFVFFSQGQPYDWFSLDDMGSLIQSEEFASTLKEAPLQPRFGKSVHTVACC